ncbi:MAG TPA: hypothetical protein VGO93_16535 [Candidatus Xenobia bacterium]
MASTTIEERKERQAKALGLRRQGMAFPAIATELGISVGQAHADCTAAAQAAGECPEAEPPVESPAETPAGSAEGPQTQAEKLAEAEQELNAAQARVQAMKAEQARARQRLAELDQALSVVSEDVAQADAVKRSMVAETRDRARETATDKFLALADARPGLAVRRSAAVHRVHNALRSVAPFLAELVALDEALAENFKAIRQAGQEAGLLEGVIKEATPRLSFPRLSTTDRIDRARPFYQTMREVIEFMINSYTPEPLVRPGPKAPTPAPLPSVRRANTDTADVMETRRLAE